MKNTKKLVCLILALVCLFATAVSASAFTGLVQVNDYLNLRKTASLKGTIIAYVGPDTYVEVLDGGNVTSGFYHIDAPSHKRTDLTDAAVTRRGYGSVDYISID